MGNSLCLAQREKKEPEYATARVSPIPAFKRRRSGSGDGAGEGPRSLLDLCVAAVASRATDLDVAVLPPELSQRVADHLTEHGAVTV
jgi:hypothetical protein